MTVLYLLVCLGCAGPPEERQETSLVISRSGVGDYPSPTMLFEPQGIRTTVTTRYLDGEPVETTESFGTETLVPILFDASGAEVVWIQAPSVPMVEPPGRPRHRVYQARPPLAPGHYQVAGYRSRGGVELMLDGPYVTFDVPEMAQDIDSIQIGDVFELKDLKVPAVGSLVDSYLLETSLRVTDIGERGVELELLNTEASCVMLSGWTEPDGGRLIWREQELRLPQDDFELVATDIDLRLPLTQGGEQILGAELVFSVQERGIDAMMAAANPDWEEGQACRVLDWFSGCGPCLGDSELRCGSVYAAEMVFNKLDTSAAAELEGEFPLCGVDTSKLVIDLSGLDLDCGCTTAAGFSSASLGWLALALLRFRRRKRKDQDKR